MACCQIMHLNCKWRLGTEMGIILKEECKSSFKPPGLCMNVASSEGQLRQLGKLKASRSPRSNVDLRKELQDFISEFDLPSDSVPSLKQLSHHGRQDLANIVRRRGYKAVSQLLADPGDICITESTGMQKMNNHDTESIEKGDKEPDPSTSVQLSVVPLLLADPGDICITESTGMQKMNNHDTESIEKGDKEPDPSTSVQLSVVPLLLADPGDICITESTGMQKMNNHDTESIEKGDKEPDPSTSVQLSVVPLHDTVGTSGTNYTSLIKENHYFQEQNSNVGIQNYQRECPSADDYFTTYTKAIDIVDSNSNYSLNSSYISLREKAAEFIQTGEFQDIDGEDENEEHQDEEENNQSISQAYDLVGSHPLIPNGDDGKASYGPSGTDSSIPSISGRLVVKNSAYESYDWSDDSPLNSNGMAADDAAFWTNEVQPFFREKSPTSFDRKLNDNSQFNVDKIPEGLAIQSAGTRQTAMELHHFKSILHTKELELAKLKQELEKEKAALYLIQLKAMEEVVRVKEIASQKESQLSGADQALSDLKQVRIEYWDHGQNVELTGSFNGWQHHIPMKPDPASEIQNAGGERGQLMWSTELWLYPGNYEIKFIVDGKWKIDPRREVVVTEKMIQNNVLRVGD